jgi:stage V sporulation protein D (sporulation-specific penicillin-binding protein)
MSDEEQVTALNELWRNYCISDSYEPGSTFKSLTVSACLDEGKTNKNRTYNCDGGQQVADRYIKCVANSYGGHGVLTVGQALMVSCNDVLMQLASSLGKTKFLDYMDAFGIGKKTGIDLPGEATGTVFDSDSMHATQLATSSFGQSQTVTMVQMAAAFSAVVNGGNYYRPHVVEEVTSESGAVIWSGSDALQSKVITEDTSKLLRKYLLAAVEDGTASPAQVKGYKVGGKTGTAEKIPRGQGKYLVSFIGCVPANNPELVIYVVIDEPNVADQAHSTYATEFASDLMKDILPLLEIYPSGKKSSVTKASKLTLPSTAKKNLDVEAPADGYVDGDETVAEDASAGEEGDTGVDVSDTDTKESTEETTEETDETTEDSDE